MIVPALQDEVFLRDVKDARERAGPEELVLWWLGQSGFLVLQGGEFVLFDPYLSDSLTRKYAATDKPHVRMTERVVDPGRLDFVRVVTSSHQHTDHFDPETLEPILTAASRAQLVLPAATLAPAEGRLGSAFRSRLVPVDEGVPLEVGPFRLEAVPAAHEERLPVYAGFILSAGPFRLYHSGDTVLYPGMAERLRPYAVDVALLPINGRAPERRVAGNLDGREAAGLARDIGARIAIPCHFEMFAFNTASPEPFQQECRRLGQEHAVLRAGERWTLGARR